MKKTLKIIGIFTSVVIVLFLLIILISSINHKIQLSKEKDLFVPNGKIVEVNKHKMHIYTEGQGNNTLVFMSGGGTSSPVLDFKSLYSLLKDDYKIAVVEKSGYGFSEDSNANRDIHTILEETRLALSKSGLQPPYIILPHSMSGIEALYWAQEYPEEVNGIIGLDMAVPKLYEDFPLNTFMLNLSAFGSKIGITRFFPAIVDDSAAIKYGSLTDEEKALYRVIFYRRTLTKSMKNEIKEIQANAEIVDKNNKPEIPMLLFISNGEGTGWDKDKWIYEQISYIKEINEGSFIKLDSSHYVHDIEYKNIAEESKRFIEDIINKY